LVLYFTRDKCHPQAKKIVRRLRAITSLSSQTCGAADQNCVGLPDSYKIYLILQLRDRSQTLVKRIITNCWHYRLTQVLPTKSIPLDG